MSELKDKAVYSMALLAEGGEDVKEFMGYAITDDEKGFTSEQEVKDYVEQGLGQLSFL